MRLYFLVDTRNTNRSTDDCAPAEAPFLSLSFLPESYTCCPGGAGLSVFQEFPLDPKAAPPRVCLGEPPLIAPSYQTLFFWAPKITANGDCSHEIKRRLLLGRKVMTKIDGILKSRDITLPTKVHLVKAMFFPVVMYGCESWTVKKAERQRIDAFELWCWRRLLRS